MMRRDRHERGSAPIEATFALLLLLFLVLGAIEVAFALYGRNVVLASAHEGARAAVELGRTEAEAVVLARDTVDRAAGGVVDRLSVDVSVARADVMIVEVQVRGVVDAWGPIPFPLPVTANATATRELLEG